MSIFTGLLKWLGIVGAGFDKLERGAEKVWNHTEETVQEIQKDSATLVKILKDNPTATPEFIVAEIKKFAPTFDKEDNIEKGLQEVWKDFALASTQPQTWQQILLTLQLYFQSIEGAKLSKQSEFIASTIALALAPNTTVWNKIGTIMWYVYQRFVKK